MAEAQHFLGRIIEVAQQLPLPAVPDARPHRTDIDHGQAQQQAQPLGALHHFDEIEDGLVIGQVALEGGGRHQQVITHQPGDGLGLRGGQAQARAEMLRHFRTQYAVVAAAPLGDVMQQHRDIEHPARQYLAHQLGRQRMIGRQFAFLDPGQQADGADGMLVHRIMMVHVELHLRHDAAEIGDEPTEHGGLVHPAQHRFRVARAGQHIHEGGIGARVLAHLGGNQASVAAGRAHRARMNLQPMPVGHGENLDQADRIGLEEIITR